MKSVAILDPETARILAEVLKGEQIPCETRMITEESGLDATEVLVSEEHFDKACDASEKWQEARAAEAEQKARRACPKCRSPRSMERVRDEHYEEMGLVVYRCTECENVVPL